MTSSHKTGLVVEDEWLLRTELQEVLSAAGWIVLEARNGEDALAQLDQFRQQDRQIDFLVTDIRLGGPADGWDVAEAARKAWPDLPVIYVSANPIVETRRVPGSAFLSKPVEVENLIATSRKLLAARP